jgi:hypothetical protein
MNKIDETDIITVCDACLCASCWHGEFMCEEAQTAGTTKTINDSLDYIAMKPVCQALWRFFKIIYFFVESA